MLFESFVRVFAQATDVFPMFPPRSAHVLAQFVHSLPYIIDPSLQPSVSCASTALRNCHIVILPTRFSALEPAPVLRISLPTLAPETASPPPMPSGRRPANPLMPPPHRGTAAPSFSPGQEHAKGEEEKQRDGSSARERAKRARTAPKSRVGFQPESVLGLCAAAGFANHRDFPSPTHRAEATQEFRLHPILAGSNRRR